MRFADLLASVDATTQRALGEAVVYTPGVGDPVTVDGIFDALYTPVALGTPAVVSSGPAVWLTLSTLPTDPLADTAATVTIRGETYRCHEPQHDGQGGVLMQLHKVA